MKKLAIVSIAALAFPAGAAYAQDIPNPPPAVSPGNAAVIEQIGSGNTVQALGGATGLDQLVKDTGSGNYAGIYQGHAGTDYDGHPATYTSTNSNAVVSQTASGGARNISVNAQYGTNQKATVTQNNSGPGQFITWVSQGALYGDRGVPSGSAGNKATVDQQVTATGNRYVNWASGDPFIPGEHIKPDFLADTSTVVAGAAVWQGGQNGVVSVTQQSAGALALVQQIGNGDGTTVNVDITQKGYALNTATVEQDGSNGRVIVTQDGLAGVTNFSYVNQYSSNSYVSVDQKGAAGINASTVTQNAGLGSDKATVIQDAQNSYSNTSTITQQDGSSAWVDQQSNHGANTATINQSGAGNSANVRQR
jgi:hypothetical protein